MSRVAIRLKNSFRTSVDTVGYSSFQCRDQIEEWKDVSALEPLEKCWVNFLCCQFDTGRWWAFEVLAISQFSQGFPWFQAKEYHRGIDFCKIDFITYFKYLKIIHLFPKRGPNQTGSCGWDFWSSFLFSSAEFSANFERYLLMFVPTLYSWDWKIAFKKSSKIELKKYLRFNNWTLRKF